MGAYNWILMEACCPVCKKQVRLRCQTHVASDYNGDQTGRFHDREYQFGEKLLWWPKEHQNYQEWRVNGRFGEAATGNADAECCYTSCPKCKAELFAIIEFHGPRSVVVKEIGLEGHWPVDYKK